MASAWRAAGAEYSLYPRGSFPSLLQPGWDRELTLGVRPDALGWIDDGGSAPKRFRLDPSLLLKAAAREDLPLARPLLPVKGSRLLEGRTIALTLASLALMPTVGEIAWWEKSEPFHVTHEGFFGESTYVGGADKASHFFFTYVAFRLLTGAYEGFGHSPADSRALAFGVSVLSGLSIEIGDGFSSYGFSPEDLTADVLGALAGVGISAWDLDDLVGFRQTYLSADLPRQAVAIPGFPSHDYAVEAYTIDFKFVGAARRLSLRPGLARFFLVSLSYGTRVYGYTPDSFRQRNLGVQLGINLHEVLAAVGVRDSTWLGGALLSLSNYIQVPYTALGFAYDLNHGHWHGPNPWHRYS